MIIVDDVPRIVVAIAACILVPLALRVVALPRLAPLAAGAGALATLSLWLPAGTLAMAIAAPYAITCAIAGAIGVRRMLACWMDAAQLAMAFGLVGLAGAATWLVAHRAGYALLGYPPFWVILTAAHFHVAGTFLPIIVGSCADSRGALARLVALGCVLGVPLTAAGIYGPHALEVTGALVMVASGLGAALLVAWTPGVRLAGLPLAIGMLLALAYGLRAHGTAITFAGLDPLSSMLVSHGVLDTLFALIALAVLARRPSRVREAPPLSRLHGQWPVGATFFARTGLERTPEHPPLGLVDSIADLDIDGTRLPATIREFYERTGQHELVVRPAWRAGFRSGSRLWAHIARRMGQLQLPVAAETGREGIGSRIVALDAAVDGRRLPRAWIRTYPDGRALYVAAYATHRSAEHAHMNIAFPVPGGQMSSVLRMVHRGRGVRVTTRLGGDCGIWLVLGGLPLRLPLNETIDVWTVDDPDAPAELRTWADGYTTIARHDLWLFGVHYLTLDYAMRPAAATDAHSR